MQTSTPSTQNFIPSRMKEAREARGFATLISLADLLDVGPSTVSRWENGEIIPPAEKIIELARILDVRVSYFSRPHFKVGSNPFFFRSLTRAKKLDRSKQRARLRWFQEISGILQHYAMFPPLNIPSVFRNDTYRQLRDEDIERIAANLREFWDLGNAPISNMIDILERAGFVIATDDMGTTALDGLCNWFDYDQRPYLLLANDKMSFFRRQMDAAHEMAHAILHRDVTEEDLKNDFELIEYQAFRLASAFLLPADVFALEVGAAPTLHKLLSLKDKWKVSVKAMIHRCADLHIIDKSQATQLYKYYSAKRWNQEEPLDKDVPITKPRLLSEVFNMIIAEGVRTKEEMLANDFIIPAQDIEMLATLNQAWFTSRLGEIVQLKASNAARMIQKSQSGMVIPFDINRRK